MGVVISRVPFDLLILRYMLKIAQTMNSSYETFDLFINSISTCSCLSNGAGWLWPFELVYHGQFDDSRPSNNIPVTGRFVIYVTAFNIFERSCYIVEPNMLHMRRDLSLAIDLVLSCQRIPSNQKPRYTQICYIFLQFFV